MVARQWKVIEKYVVHRFCNEYKTKHNLKDKVEYKLPFETQTILP